MTFGHVAHVVLDSRLHSEACHGCGSIWTQSNHDIPPGRVRCVCNDDTARPLCHEEASSVQTATRIQLATKLGYVSASFFYIETYGLHTRIWHPTYLPHIGRVTLLPWYHFCINCKC